MNIEKMGRFIAELRKEKHLTQSELAEALNITDKAVSKWERGLSCPDISILTDLARILGVNTGELLEAERSNKPNQTAEKTEVAQSAIDTVIKYAEQTLQKKSKFIRTIIAYSLYGTFFAAILSCSITNIAISGRLTWALIPIASCIFASLLTFPVLSFGKKGQIITLAILSIDIIPFLHILSAIIGTRMIVTIGTAPAAAGIIYIWVIFAFCKIFARKPLLIIAISVLCAVPLNIFINYYLYTVIKEPIVDSWDILSYSILLLASCTLFAVHFARKLSHSK